MRSFFLLLFAAALFGVTKQDVVSAYSQKNFSKSCLDAKLIASHFENDEQFLRLYGNACLKADYIDLVVWPAIRLHRDALSREASAAFLTVALKKKLLLQSLFDGSDISGIRLPKVDNVLSNVFDMYVAKNYVKDGEKYKMKSPGGELLLFVTIESGVKKMIIEEKSADAPSKRHSYW